MKKIILFIFISALLVSCNKTTTDKKFKVISDGAKGSHVNLYTSSNDGMKMYLEKKFKKDMLSKYNIELDVKNMSYEAVKETLDLYSKEGVVDGDIDLLVLNRDEFEDMLSNDYFYKDINKDMSNYNEYINALDKDFSMTKDFKDRVIAIPFYRKQLVFLYDDDILETAPKDIDGFLEFVKENKNKFTFPNPLKNRNGMRFVEYVIFNKLNKEDLDSLRVETDKEKIKLLLKPAMDYLKELDDYILKNDDRYYDTIEDINKLFKESEIYFNFTNEFSEVLDDKEERYPFNTKTFMMGKTGVETYYLLVPNTARNKGGAFVLINDLIGHTVQAEMVKDLRLKILPILDINLLDSEKKSHFKYNDKFVPINEFIKNREFEFSVSTRDSIKGVFEEMLEEKKKELEEKDEEKEKVENNNG